MALEHRKQGFNIRIIGMPEKNKQKLFNNKSKLFLKDVKFGSLKSLAQHR